MKKKKDLINLIFSPKLLLIEWSFIVLFCVFIGCSIRSEAATQTSTKIPYNVAEWSSYNEMMLERVDIAIQQYKTAFPSNADKPLLIWTQDGFYNGAWFQYYIMPEPYYDNTIAQDFDFNNNTLRFKTHYEVVTIIVGINGDIGGTLLPHSTSADLMGNSASVNTGQGAYLPRYPFYYDGDPITSTNDLEVLISRVNGQATSGSATQPDLTGDNIGNDKPDIDDYLPNIPSIPNLDNSSLEKIAESIFNILVWGFNAIKGILQGLFEYLADTFTYSIQKVIDNIKNAIQNFYDNMKSLFEPLLNGLAEIAQGIKQTIENIGLLLETFFAPFDEEQFKEAYQNCDFINAVDGVNDSIEEFEHAFTYAEERDHYTLYLGFMMDGYTVNYDLDFTWLYPLRQYYRPIIWAVVIYEFFVYLCSQLSDYLQGRSGK